MRSPQSGLQTKLEEEAAFAKGFSGQPSLSVFALALLKLRRTCFAVSFLVGSAMHSPKGEMVGAQGIEPWTSPV
jgi:hypothetical protein